MEASHRQFVRERAGCRCEYCHLPEFAAPGSAFHAEHIVAKQHGGTDALSNRCWSCQRCNLHKGPNLSGRDPLTGQVVRLFHPRRQSWKRHFEWIGAHLAGLSKAGRATVAVLNINHPKRVDLRRMIMDAGDWPED